MPKASKPARPIPRKRHTVTAGQRSTFLEKLAAGLSIRSAREMASIARSTVYRHRKEDAEFRKLWDEAIEDGTDRLEDEALRRALSGTERPIFQGGKQVGAERIYSDRLLELLLRARRPKKYRPEPRTPKEDATKPTAPPPVPGTEPGEKRQVFTLRIFEGGDGSPIVEAPSTPTKQ